jgi:branched-subunit amino acid transport protein
LPPARSPTRFVAGMSKETTIWLAIFAVGAINYVARLSFIALFARRDMPPLLDRALRHVPAAMLTAIVVPAVVFAAPGVLRLDPGNAKLIAAVIAFAVAAWSRSTTLTIVVGMTVLWLTQYAVG